MSNTLKPTVMPKDKSLEVQQNYLGGPGIQIPANAQDISAFTTIEKTDVNELQARIEAQQAAKAAGGPEIAALNAAPGIQIPKNPENIDAFQS